MPGMISRVNWVVALSVISVPFTLTHSIEDFQYGIAAHFGLPVLLAAFLLSIGYAVQVLATALAARGSRLGFLGNLVIAAIWLFGAVFDHLGEILFADPYRSLKRA